MSNRKWVTNYAYGYVAGDELKRCACGNTNLHATCHTYEDGTRGYSLSCWDCGRQIEVDGRERDLFDAWNNHVAHAAEIIYAITSIPETVTIFASAEDDLNELLKEKLFEQVRFERVIQKSEN